MERSGLLLLFMRIGPDGFESLGRGDGVALHLHQGGPFRLLFRGRRLAKRGGSRYGGGICGRRRWVGRDEIHECRPSGLLAGRHGQRTPKGEVGSVTSPAACVRRFPVKKNEEVGRGRRRRPELRC